jgi:hypothetical protein
VLQRGLVTVAVLILVLLIGLAVAPAAASEPVPERCTTASFRPFAAEVWTVDWRRGAPPDSTIDAKNARLQCAPPRHRRAMRNIWDRQRTYYFARRSKKLRQRRLDRVTPFGRWAIPGHIVMCESHGDFRAYNAGYEPNGPGSGPGGAYQIIAQTWAAYGGRAFAPRAHEAAPLGQHIVAGRIWDAVGSSAWECA